MKGAVFVALVVATALRLSAQAPAAPPVPVTATALRYASGTKPVEARGGGAYDLGGSLIILDGRLTGGPPSSLITTRWTAAGWSDPAPVFPGFPAFHAGAQVSPDGAHLYFESNRRDPPDTTRQDSDLWIADRTATGWSTPRPLGAPFNSPHNEHNVTVGGMGTICFNSSRPTITAGHDILCSSRGSSGWAEPLPLDTAVKQCRTRDHPVHQRR